MNDHEVKRLDGEIKHLRELVYEFRQSDKEALAAAMAAAKEAIAKAEDATEKRLELLNEFRGQAEVQQANYLRIPVYEAKHSELITRVERLEAWVSTTQGREKGISSTSGVLMAVAMFVFVALGGIAAVVALIIAN